jgi:hypothetical protein
MPILCEGLVKKVSAEAIAKYFTEIQGMFKDDKAGKTTSEKPADP